MTFYKFALDKFVFIKVALTKFAQGISIKAKSLHAKLTLAAFKIVIEFAAAFFLSCEFVFFDLSISSNKFCLSKSESEELLYSNF